MSSAAVDVSVVVCTYNRAGLLRDALASLGALETDGQFRYDILVVDNASTDETPAVIEEASRTAPVPLRGVREPCQGIAFARNRGVRETTAAWIAFFDDDQIAEPRWLIELLALAREKGARCVGGANRLLTPPGSRSLAPICRWMLGETLGGEAPAPYRGRLSPGTGNVLLHRSIFEEVGTFDETRRVAGEDGDLFRRMRRANIDGWYTPRAVMHHVVPGYRLEDGYLRWKSWGYGRNLAQNNRRARGALAVLLLMVLRLGHALVVSLPRFAWARLRGAETRALGARCMLWRTEGYTRFVLHMMAPRLFPQRRFLEQLEFLAERDLFVPKNQSSAAAVCAAATGEGTR